MLSRNSGAVGGQGDRFDLLAADVHDLNVILLGKSHRLGLILAGGVAARVVGDRDDLLACPRSISAARIIAPGSKYTTAASSPVRHSRARRSSLACAGKVSASPPSLIFHTWIVFSNVMLARYFSAGPNTTQRTAAWCGKRATGLVESTLPDGDYNADKFHVPQLTKRLLSGGKCTSWTYSHWGAQVCAASWPSTDTRKLSNALRLEINSFSPAGSKWAAVAESRRSTTTLAHASHRPSYKSRPRARSIGQSCLWRCRTRG